MRFFEKLAVAYFFWATVYIQGAANKYPPKDVYFFAATSIYFMGENAYSLNYSRTLVTLNNMSLLVLMVTINEILILQF